MLKLDDGETQQEILMYRDHVGVVLGRLLWHEMHSFSTGCVLLIAASDYIRNYDDFLQCARDH